MGEKKKKRVRLQRKDCVIHVVLLQNQPINSVIHYLKRLIWAAENQQPATEASSNLANLKECFSEEESGEGRLP